jgi:DsbC/DsbD-like thiol-disulfide interchange protein
MISRRILLASLSTLALGLPAAPAAAAASAWADGFEARVRLVAGGSDGSARLAAVEMDLAPGFKTYWRHPGESGLPPTFDWSGSKNLDRVEVMWPAPRRFEDAGGVTYGWDRDVLIPLRVVPKHPDKPVRLFLKLAYGVCKDICVPNAADLALDLGPGDGPHRERVEAALARVPKPRPLGADGELAILSAEPRADGPKGAVAVRVRAPGAGAPALFVEAPDGWYLAAERPPTRDGDGATFMVEVLERPREIGGALPLRLTLVAGERAIETEASLDTAALPR